MADRLEHLDRPVGRFQGSPARRERAQPATARTGRLQPGARGNLVYATGLNATTQLPPRLMGSRLDPTVVRHRCRGPLGTLKRRGKLGRLMQGLLEFLTQLGDPTLYGEDSSLKKTTPLLPELAIFNRFQTILLLTFSNHHHRLQKMTCTPLPGLPSVALARVEDVRYFSLHVSGVENGFQKNAISFVASDVASFARFVEPTEN